MFNVEDVTLTVVSITDISDMIESLKFVVDRNEFNNELCCEMLDEFWTLKDAEINVRREYDVVAK